MTAQHIETLIIGAGQAGLSTGYHLQQRGLPFLIVDGNDRVGDNWRQQWDTLRLYTPGQVRRPARACRSRPTPWSLPAARTRSPTTSRATRSHFDLPGADAAPGSTGSRRGPTAASRRPIGDRHDHLRQRRRRHRHLRADAERARLRRRARPVDPAAALERVPAPRRAQRRARAGGRRLALRLDIAYEVAEHRPDHPVRAATAGRSPFTSELADGHGSSSRDRGLRVAARADPAHADRAQGDGRGAHHGGPMLRVKPRGPRPRAASSGCEARVAGVQRRRCRVLDDGTVVDVSQRRLVHRVPAGLRLDQAAGLRRGRLAGASTAASSRTAPGLFFCGLAFQYAFSSMVLAGRRPGRGVPRRQDRRRRSGAHARRLKPDARPARRYPPRRR